MRSLTEVIREASIDLSARASNGSLDKIAGALTLKRGEQLASSEKALVFEMYKQNMGHVFQSIGEEFVDAEKESYLFAPNSFFVFAGSSSQLTGFALFRLEPDDLDEPEYPVVFLYELQVAAPHQGSGLGRQVRLPRHVCICSEVIEISVVVPSRTRANQAIRAHINGNSMLALPYLRQFSHILMHRCSRVTSAMRAR